MRGLRRVIDPGAPAIAIKEQRLGVVSQRTIRRDQQTANRYLEKPQPQIITIALGPWFREDVAGTATSSMRLMTMGTGPAFASSGTGLPYKSLRAGRVLGAAMYSNSAITGGIATAAVFINGSNAGAITDCELNTVNTRSAVYVLPWANGIPFAADDTIEPRVTTAALLPAAAADISIILYLGFDAST